MSKSLIIYFSRADENYSVGYIDKGNTEYIAEFVQELTGADMFKVEPAVPYAADYNICIEEAKKRVGNAPFTICQFADDLLGFMDEQQIEKTHLLGFSDGGNIAMVFAIQWPGRVDRLILNGANLNASGVKRTTQLPIEIGYKIARRFADKSDSARLNAEMLGLMVNEPNVEPGELAGIQAKTLVIAGTNDMIKEEHTRQIANNIQSAELVFIKGNHFIANKCPEEFNRTVLGFLHK